jgi:hypothetical protein
MPKGRTMPALVAAAALAGICGWSSASWACAPAAAWVPGHWEWQGNGHVWVPGHATLPRSAYGAHDAHDEDVALLVRDAAHERDQRDAREQPRDLDRRLAR